MKFRALALIFTAAGLAAASQPVLAASSKSDARIAALVAALQAVSPDPLGGRLGLDVSARTMPLKLEPGRSPLAAQPVRTESTPRPALPATTVPKS